MARKKTVKAVKAPTLTKNDTIVLDLEVLLVPIAILIGALMISLSIIFSLKGNTIKTTTGTTTDTTTTTDDAEVEVTGEVTIDDDPYKGDKKKAKIAIVEFTDYECPFCQRHFQETYPDLMKNYVDTGKAIYVLRDFPLSFHDPAATAAAIAGQCVFEQGGNDKYFDFHDKYFETSALNGQGVAGGLKEFGKKISGIDQSKYEKCIDDKKYAEEVALDLAAGSGAGITGTPGFIIGKLDSDGKTLVDGVLLAGAYPYADFQRILDGLLK